MKSVEAFMAGWLACEEGENDACPSGYHERFAALWRKGWYYRNGGGGVL